MAKLSGNKREYARSASCHPAPSNSICTIFNGECLDELLEALADIDDEPAADDGAVAMRWVMHAKFGRGQILRIEGDKTRVRFDDGSERVIASRILVPVDTPAT